MQKFFVPFKTLFDFGPRNSLLQDSVLEFANIVDAAGAHVGPHVETKRVTTHHYQVRAGIVYLSKDRLPLKFPLEVVNGETF